ncbi:MAG: IreB family regulatory phosphoprotein [Clostridia bacterium]|nr:IreB family regulatory phosphoprotein [Clostridia bacterium]
MKKATPQERYTLLCQIRDILVSQNYDPLRQISGYLLTEDPTYIPDCQNARSLIVEIDRADLLDDLLRLYFKEA